MVFQLFGKPKRRKLLDQEATPTSAQQRAKKGSDAKDTADGATAARKGTSPAVPGGGARSSIDGLLRMDPSLLNSKQRRLVRRHQDSMQQQQNSSGGGGGGADDDDAEAQQAPQPPETKEHEVQSTILDEIQKGGPLTAHQNEADGSAAVPSAPSEQAGVAAHGEFNREESKEEDDEDDHDRPKDLLEARSANEDSEKEKRASDSDIDDDDGDGDDGDSDDGHSDENSQRSNPDALAESDPSDEFEKLLPKLTSKVRRTLTRKLERDGDVHAALAAAQQAIRAAENDAAMAALKVHAASNDPTPPPSADVGHGGDAEEGGSSSSSSKRKRDGDASADWSHLPVDERMRREEQRRKQQEAAEKRQKLQQEGEEKGPAAAHKHPLNSERRRANRRKPKHAPPKKSPAASNHKKRPVDLERQQHMASGYRIRKNQQHA
jgi:hypothetical protein